MSGHRHLIGRVHVMGGQVLVRKDLDTEGAGV